MKSRTVVLVAMLVVSLPLAGCFKRDDPNSALSGDQAKVDDLLGKAGNDKLVDAAAIIPKNYSFGEQALLPPVKLAFSGTIGVDAVGGYEAERDEGGIDYNSKIEMFDISSGLPAGQAAEIVVKVFWDASEFNSGDIDLVIDMPGLKTSYSPTSETWNWNYAVKTVVVNAVGVEGVPALVGVEISSVLAQSGFDYKLDVSLTYVKDVLTPYHAWALDVPSTASGLIFESEKAGGDEHIEAQFILVDPEDQLVQFVDFNDINIPTQSVFIPTTKAGTYVFYAYSMHGGFLRVKADVPLVNAIARPLALVEKVVVDSAAPMPGIAGKDWLNATADSSALNTDTGATTVTFSPEGAFPLRVTPYVKGQFTSMAKITLSSPLGVVAQRTVVMRYEDERGTLGYTSDHEGTHDHVYSWKNIQRGSWKADIVNNNANVELGHIVTSYVRA